MTNNELLYNAKADLDAALYNVKRRQIQLALEATRAAHRALEELEMRLRSGGIVALMKLQEAEVDADL